MDDQPKRRGRPPGTGRAPEAVTAPVGMTRVEIISHLHAFGPEGEKYECGATPTVPESVAEGWIRHGRAMRI